MWTEKKERELFNKEELLEIKEKAEELALCGHRSHIQHAHTSLAEAADRLLTLLEQDRDSNG